MPNGERALSIRGRDRAALARAVRRYDGAPAGARLHVRGRALLADLLAVERAVPRAGTIVDLGCGHGLVANLLVEASGERRVVGIDPDERKIAVAKLTERDGLRFEVGDATRYELSECDAVTIVDVLYLLPEPLQDGLVAAAARALRPGGVLVVYAQERRADPRFWLGYLQELLATGLGVTKGGAGLHYARREEMLARIEQTGLAALVRPLPRRLYTDAIYVGRKP